MGINASSKELCEYVATVKWIKTVERSEAKMKRKAGLYTTTHIRASLGGQPKTVAFLEDAFSLKISEHLAQQDDLSA